MTTRPSQRSLGAASVLAALALSTGLAACGDNDNNTAAADPAAPSTPMTVAMVEASATTPTGAVRGCDGVWITPGAPASRILSLRNYVTETLVALGVGDRVVGQVNAGSFTPLASTKTAYEKVPVIAEAAPSKEQVLAARPDLVVGDGSWAFDGKAVPTQKELVGDGVAPLVIPTACLDEDKGEPSFDDVYDTLAALGTLTGSKDAAARLTSWGKDRVAQTAQQLTGDAPTVYAGTLSKGELFAYDRGSYAPILEALKVDNALPSGAVPAGSTFTQLSREQVLRTQPDALIITYLDDADRKVQEEQVAERLAGLEAVRDDRVVYVPEAFFTGGLQTLQRIPEVAFTARNLSVPAALASSHPPVAAQAQQ